MIPIRLSVKNFLSYRDNVPTLDLEGVHVACLCGDNGHGKSALLDAITWVLWGSSRARVQEDLIFQGESEMQVDLEFQAGEGRYRVSRRYARSARSRQGATVLELFFNTENGPQPLTGNSVRETEAKIRSLLHMDYDTFVNSAFILQGRADMFTKSGAARRKEVLGEVLDLSWYDRLAEKARGESRDQERTAERLEAEVAGIDRELSHKEEHEARLTEIQSEMRIVEREERGWEAELESLQEESRKLQGLQQEIERLEQDEKRILGEVMERESRTADMSKRLEEVRSRASQLTALEAELAQVRSRLEELAAPSEEAGSLGELIRELESRANHLREINASLREEELRLQGFQQELERLERDEKRTQEEVQERELRNTRDAKRIEELRAKASELPSLEAGLASAAARLEELASPSAEAESRRGRIQELQSEARYLSNENARLRTEMGDLRVKVDLLEETGGPNGIGATCPLCDNILGPEGCLHLASSYRTQGENKANAHRDNQAVIKKAEAEVSSLEKDLERMESERRREQAVAQERRDSLTRDVEQANAAGEEATRLAASLEFEESLLAASRRRFNEIQADMPSLREAVSTLPGILDSYRQNSADIQKAESERNGLEKDLEGIESDRRKEQSLAEERRDSLTRNVEEARAAGALVDQLAASLESEKSLLEASRLRTKDVQDAMPPLRQAGTALPGILDSLQESRSRLESLRGRRQQLLRDLGEMQARLDRCLELETRRQECSNTLADASFQKGVYDQLSTAFGKGGIQALLIEQAIPELENQANDILGRVSDHRMSLKLETQRERRSSGGDPIETLDIKISDELGTRSYENYSGGEAFRINFALRIALSRLLAHRSGAPLPTLFIDEGFGSQDAAGLEKLVEAINAIQNDFQKIVVITHIEELKEAFPVRIEVTKTLQGSTFQMS